MRILKIIESSGRDSHLNQKEHTPQCDQCSIGQIEIVNKGGNIYTVCQNPSCGHSELKRTDPLDKTI